ncbi:MAG: hypothetical protein Q8K63_15890 [Acidimicrobiales bacterium]|nr:hypothetical protein [Acidimicrobiales bacterium]
MTLENLDRGTRTVVVIFTDKVDHGCAACGHDIVAKFHRVAELTSGDYVHEKCIGALR